MVNAQELDSIKASVLKDVGPLITAAAAPQLDNSKSLVTMFDAMLTNVKQLNIASKLLSENLVKLDKTLDTTVENLADIRTVKDVTFEAYKEKETIMERKAPVQGRTFVRERAPSVSRDEDIGGILQTLIKNPIVGAAIAGMIYKMLPKDRQDQIKAVFSTLFDEIKKMLPNLDELNTGLKVAGGALAAYFGVKLIGTAAAALAGVIRLISALVKLPFRAGKKFFNMSAFGKIALLAGGVGAAVFGAQALKDENVQAKLEDINKAIEDFSGVNIKESAQKGVAAVSGAYEKLTTPGVSGTTIPERVLGAGSAAVSSIAGGARSVVRNVASFKSKDLILKELDAAGISDPKSQANIFAQIDRESGFRPRSENLGGYSAKRLFELFGEGNKSGNRVRFKTIKDAEKVVAQGEQAVGEVLYGNRADLGNTSPGDGYKYRGRGFIQLTGKDAYQKVGQIIGIDLVNNPDLANEPSVAAKIVPAFYLVYKGVKPEDLKSIDAVSKATGSADKRSRKERLELSKVYEKEITAPQTPVPVPQTGTSTSVAAESTVSSFTVAEPSPLVPPVIIADNKITQYSSTLEASKDDKAKAYQSMVAAGQASIEAAWNSYASMIGKLSEGVEAQKDRQVLGAGTSINNIDNGANFTAKATPRVNQPIPSPVASRGPLELNVRHGTPAVPAGSIG
jgi:predicted chitinase